MGSGWAIGLSGCSLMIQNSKMWIAIEIAKKRLKAVFKYTTIIYYRIQVGWQPRSEDLR